MMDSTVALFCLRNLATKSRFTVIVSYVEQNDTLWVETDGFDADGQHLVKDLDSACKWVLSIIGAKAIKGFVNVYNEINMSNPLGREFESRMHTFEVYYSE